MDLLSLLLLEFYARKTVDRILPREYGESGPQVF